MTRKKGGKQSYKQTERGKVLECCLKATLRAGSMLGGRPASGRDVVWKNRKRTSEKLEEILASEEKEEEEEEEEGLFVL